MKLKPIPQIETRYLVHSHYGESLKVKQFTGVRTQTKVKLSQYDLAFSCKSYLSFQQWDALGKTPEQAREIYIAEETDRIAERKYEIREHRRNIEQAKAMSLDYTPAKGNEV